MNAFYKIQGIILRHQFAVAMVITILIAFTMTAISLSLYSSSGTLQLDLSRPGYETARKEIINPEDKDEFATNGPINKKSLEEFQALYDAQRKELNSIGKYNDKGLDDESLTLWPAAPPQN